MTLAPGTKLGPYEILSPLGAGGMGEVVEGSSMKITDPLIGTWKLDVAKSDFWALQQSTVRDLIGTYRELGNDVIEVTATGARSDGSPISLSATFPRWGGGTVAAEGISYVVTAINPYSFYLTIMQDGKQILLYHSVISKDCKTKRDEFKGVDSTGKTYEGVEVWDRQ